MLERLKGIGFDECLVSQSSDTSSGTSGRLSSAELGVVWDGNGELQTLSGVFHRAIRDGRSSNESRDESAKEKSAGSAVYRVLIVRTVGPSCSLSSINWCPFTSLRYLSSCIHSAHSSTRVGEGATT